MRSALLLAALTHHSELAKPNRCLRTPPCGAAASLGEWPETRSRPPSIQERTDAIATPLAATRTAVGAMLLFRPPGATAMFGPRGVAAFQIFYVSHFYLRLAVKAVVKVGFL